ncbi:MAG: cysteine--tRNA ligase [Gemmatimonadaceae bacterium]
MTDFRLYNTLTRSVEPFAPAHDDTVRMYTCGPTVYNPAHLGNFRTFLFEDLLRRALLLRGWGVEQVMNLTDVDDKIIRRAGELGTTIDRVTVPVIEIFQADRAYLRIQPAEHYPRATDYIPQMIALVERLMTNGLAYQAEDGSVYFAIDRFPSYGRLSRLDKRQLKAGARVAQDDYTKENAQDFALWKAAKEEDERVGAAWDSPWGRGRPGWHLECSAMAMDILGETLDLHCGGIDLVFPHHEDEIAQSEGATGKPFSRLWCHGEFLLVDNSKMAKRVGNVSTVKELREAGISAAALRHFILSTHYRKQLNFTIEALEGSAEAVRRIGGFAGRLRDAGAGTPELAAAAERAEMAVRAALADDLNGPEALAALFTFVSEGNAELDRRGRDAGAVERAREVYALINGVLDVEPDVTRVAPDGTVRRVLGAVATGGAAEESPVDVAGGGDPGDGDVAWAVERRAARAAARASRDFAAADAIRDELGARGWQVQDTSQGTILDRFH